MAELLFPRVAQRNAGEVRSVFFQWPRENEAANFNSQTYQVSIDGGLTFFTGVGVITENPVDGDFAEYEIPWVEAERPIGTGSVVYKVNDGTDYAKLFVNILSTPISGEVVAPALPTEDAFTSIPEMERVLSVQGVQNHLEDLITNTEVTNEIIIRATEKCREFLRGRFSLDDMKTNFPVRQRATYIALYLLSKRQGNPSLYGDDYAEAIADLQDARDGIINWGLAAPARMLVQTQYLDSRYYQQARINRRRSTVTFPGQALPYIYAWWA